MKGRRIANIAAVLLAAWLAGFAWFVAQATSRSALPATADGIVALTGGADRIGTALQLLQQGRAKLLLISGVGPGATLASLAREGAMDATALSPCITLGRDATTTLGNARETAAWAGRHGLHSLILVTAFYHMPRAMLELGRALPGATLYAAPVLPETFRQHPAAALRLLASEYAKYLFTASGLTRLSGPAGAA